MRDAPDAYARLSSTKEIDTVELSSHGVPRLSKSLAVLSSGFLSLIYLFDGRGKLWVSFSIRSISLNMRQLCPEVWASANSCELHSVLAFATFSEHLYNMGFYSPNRNNCMFETPSWSLSQL